ncbi:DUF2634 domain-containing protein [Paenibacillus ferrarius]|uniref:DUF2634 domain-containing protein n=1 Tax=Paenibacillus ferrarius TaxID=1469647 RepID=UPI003D2C3116
MIPAGGIGNEELQQTQQPSKTYALDPVNGRIVGAVDGLEAVKQAVYKIMETERFNHIVYGPDYGNECDSLLGRSSAFVRSEVGRRITEALLQDDRITAVEDMSVTFEGESALATFTVVSRYGNYQAQKGVNADV